VRSCPSQVIHSPPTPAPLWPATIPPPCSRDQWSRFALPPVVGTNGPEAHEPAKETRVRSCPSPVIHLASAPAPLWPATNSALMTLIPWLQNNPFMPEDIPTPLPHKHLRRLSLVWVENPLYFITACVAGRTPILASDATHAILREVWETGGRLHGWQVGRYVLMPDHVHLFCTPNPGASHLSSFVRGWKEWSCKHIRRRLGRVDFQWQPNFFDHVLRSEQSYSEKCQYIRNNPVRAGLVEDANDWPYAGHLHFS